MIVYRGQTISMNELKSIQENVGQLISLNSFISTTFEQTTAEAFSLSGDPSGEHVIFQIHVNKNIVNSKPFANISSISQFFEEREVLFMAGSIFEIKRTTFSELSNTWNIELHLCNDDAYELNDVYQEDKNIASKEKSPFSLAAVLLRMNLFDKAKKYYARLLDEELINKIPLIDLTVNCYWGLGNVARKQGDYDISLAYNCLAIEQSQDRPELLLRSYKYISMNYLEIDSISEALEYQMKALEIQREINDAHDEIADTMFNIGTIFSRTLKSDNDSVLDYFFQALKIYQELNMFDEIIRCFHALGEVYLRKNEKGVALDYHLKALQLIDTHFTTYLPYRIISCEYIARIYESMRDYMQAFKYYNEALNAKLKYEPVNDPKIASSYADIAGVYHMKGDFAKAIEMYDKAIEVWQYTQPISNPHIKSLAELRNNLQECIE
ncbi:unnamed protein product [Rotaria sp. Silwood2]|nr:unnamed protein product [Rotaria sp. Silwood2]CAF4460346.1 unnamed protein product [Rotaria sp. Silwood2]